MLVKIHWMLKNKHNKIIHFMVLIHLQPEMDKVLHSDSISTDHLHERVCLYIIVAVFFACFYFHVLFYFWFSVYEKQLDFILLLLLLLLLTLTNIFYLLIRLKNINLTKAKNTELNQFQLFFPFIR